MVVSGRDALPRVREPPEIGYTRDRSLPKNGRAGACPTETDARERIPTEADARERVPTEADARERVPTEKTDAQERALPKTDARERIPTVTDARALRPYRGITWIGFSGRKVIDAFGLIV
jgi:hypothetical protein